MVLRRIVLREGCSNYISIILPRQRQYFTGRENIESEEPRATGRNVDNWMATGPDSPSGKKKKKKKQHITPRLSNNATGGTAQTITHLRYTPRGPLEITLHVHITEDRCSALDPHRWCRSQRERRLRHFPSAKHSLPFMSKSVKLLRGEEARKEEIWRGKEAEKERGSLCPPPLSSSTFPPRVWLALTYERRGKACKRSKKEDPVQ